MNQCMGCQAGWPIKRVYKGRDGRVYETHEVVGGYFGEGVGCTKERYEPITLGDKLRSMELVHGKCDGCGMRIDNEYMCDECLIKNHSSNSK